MRPKRLMLEGISKRDRHQVIADIGAAVTSADGWVVNHTLFSNIAAAFQLSLPAGKLADFRAKLEAASVRLDAESLSRLEETTSPEDVDIFVSLALTFIHNEPDLRREIPAVPG